MKRIDKFLHRKSGADDTFTRAVPGVPSGDTNGGGTRRSTKIGRHSARFRKMRSEPAGDNEVKPQSDQEIDVELQNEAARKSATSNTATFLYSDINTSLAIAVHDVSLNESSFPPPPAEQAVGRGAGDVSQRMANHSTSGPRGQSVSTRQTAETFTNGTSDGVVNAPEPVSSASHFQYSLATFDVDAGARSASADSNGASAQRRAVAPANAVEQLTGGMQSVETERSVANAGTKETEETTKAKSKKGRIAKRIVKLLTLQSSSGTTELDGTADRSVQDQLPQLDVQSQSASVEFAEQGAAELSSGSGIRSRVKNWRRRMSATKRTIEIEQRVQIADDNAAPSYVVPLLAADPHSSMDSALRTDVQFLDYIRGRNVRLSSGYCVVTRSLDRAAHANAFVFVSRPLETDELLVLKILGLDSSFGESLTIGLLACSPLMLADRFGDRTVQSNAAPRDDQGCAACCEADASRTVVTGLPDDPAGFDVRQLLLPNAVDAESLALGDELAIGIDSQHRLLLIRNGDWRKPLVLASNLHDVCRSAQPDQPGSSRASFWLYFDLRGRVVKLKSLGAVRLPLGHSHCAVGELIPLDGPPSVPPPRPPPPRLETPLRIVHSRGGSCDSNFKKTELRDSVVVRAQRPLRRSAAQTQASRRTEARPHTASSDTGVVTLFQSADDMLREFAGHNSPQHAAVADLWPPPTSPDLLVFDNNDDPYADVDVDPDVEPEEVLQTASAVVLQYAAECSNDLCHNDATSCDQRTIEECAICFDRSPDCAIYKCGHVCMCNECARSLLAVCTARGRPPACPICQQPIIDIIKIYKA